MKGRIIKLVAGLYTVYSEELNESYEVKPLGIFRHRDMQPKVGDIVEFSDISITKIDNRTNDLVRPAICNIDQAFVVTSVKEPELNLNLLDRFLVILEYNDIKPILVFNKWDLVDEDEKDEYLKIINYYQKIGYQSLITTTKNHQLANMKDFITSHVSVITGQSGAGKSSLLNEIAPEKNFKTNEISKALNRGKHTTRHTELIHLYDGWIADTPGFGNLNFVGMSEQDLSHNMKELFEKSDHCKYNGCLHENEPKCAIKEAVMNKEILETRYHNYCLFLEEVRKLRKW